MATGREEPGPLLARVIFSPSGSNKMSTFCPLISFFVLKVSSVSLENGRSFDSGRCHDYRVNEQLSVSFGLAEHQRSRLGKEVESTFC